MLTPGNTSVYAAVDDMVRERLLARPQARGRGKSAAFIANTAAVAVWIARKHGPYGARIFTACREVLRKIFKFDCRAAIKALEQIGFLKFLPRANGHERKFRSPEYAAFQFEIGLDFALLFPAALQTRQVGERDLLLKTDSPVSGRFVSDVAARTWDRLRPEFRLGPRARKAIQGAALATLEALQGVPLPPASARLLATLKRPAGFYGR